MKMRQHIEIGNFYTKSTKINENNKNDMTAGFQNEKSVPLYLGSGDFGGCFDGNGLMETEFLSRVNQNTVFMHADFWHKGPYGIDLHLPMMQIRSDGLDEGYMVEREQKLNVLEGHMTTKMIYGQSELELKAYFNPYLRDVFALEITYQMSESEMLPSIVFKNIPTVKVDYNVTLNSSLQRIQTTRQVAEYQLEAGTAEALILFKVLEELGQVAIISEENTFGIKFVAGTGKVMLLMGAGSPKRRVDLLSQVESIQDIKTYSHRAKRNWEKRWGDSRLAFDYPKLQQLFIRSIYYMLCSFSSSDNCIAPPTGWTGSNWAYHFPQDFALITPVLLKMGHLDIVKAKVEFYARHITSMQEYTQRIYKAEGTMWAWEFPIGDNRTILPDEFPNWYQFEIHNAAYPAKMAFEASAYIKDTQWTKDIAWPIIYNSAKFYTSILKKEGTTWGIHLYPSMGQDELGGVNAKNYLCALYAARFTLRKALEMAKQMDFDSEETQKWQEILSEGLAFDRLIHTQLGIYQNYEVQEHLYEIGKMKHPVPLMPITFLPQDELNSYERNAFARRYTLCDQSDKHFYHGWSLVDLMFADAKMGDKEGFMKDFDEMLIAHYVDKDFLQIYESSTLYPCIYYITSHGLLAQAVLEGALNKNSLGFKKLNYHHIHLEDKTVHGGE
jgi:hypothetical protein